MPRRFTAFVATLAIALSMTTAAAGAAERQYTGKVRGTDALIGLIENGSSVSAYVCDGDADSVSLSAWFKGRVRGGRLKARTGGVRLAAKRSRKRFRGTVALPGGKRFGFTARRVARRGGLHELGVTLDGRPYRGGWIVLPNGTTRGLLA